MARMIAGLGQREQVAVARAGPGASRRSARRGTRARPGRRSGSWCPWRRRAPGSAGPGAARAGRAAAPGSGRRRQVRWDGSDRSSTGSPGTKKPLKAKTPQGTRFSGCLTWPQAAQIATNRLSDPRNLTRPAGVATRSGHEPCAAATSRPRTARSGPGSEPEPAAVASIRRATARSRGAGSAPARPPAG